MKELKETVDMMNSNDYKERFKAEYTQTKIRYDKLHNMITKYEAGTLEFEPTNPISLLKEQAEAMEKYLHALEVRAEIEGVDLKEDKPLGELTQIITLVVTNIHKDTQENIDKIICSNELTEAIIRTHMRDYFNPDDMQIVIQNFVR